MRIFLLTLLAIGCSKLPPKPILTMNQVADDRHSISKPDTRYDGKFGELLEVNTSMHLEKVVDVRTYTEALAKVITHDVEKEASNINLFDEIPDSTWFTNRNGRKPMSPAEVEKGPTTFRLASDGPLLVASGKSSGVTPGFVVKDKNGQRFVLKFDPPGGCGLPSSADVISSRFFYAAGYNVPENNIEYIDLKRIDLDPKATTRGKYMKKVPLTKEAFENILKSIAPCQKEGKQRAMASRFIEGKPVGPFSYRGKRQDDANDHISHENRRELRGLSVLAAWLQHTDWTSYNSFDSFIETEKDQGYILHYLIDFGGTLGAESTGPKLVGAGDEYDIDYGSMALNLLALGVREPSWKKETPVKFESIGRLRLTDFDPERWVPSHPNPAMLERTKRDTFWGAKLVASFTDEQIAAAVRAAALPEEGAPAELEYLLKARRDIIANHWFSKVGAMDQFEIKGTELTFVDWRRTGPWAKKGSIDYVWNLGGKGVDRSGRTSERKIVLFESQEQFDRWKTGKSRYLKLTIHPSSELSTDVYLYLTDDGRMVWVGAERDV